MKKTLFALLACATLAAPAMAKDWWVENALAGAYSNDPERNTENYTFYTFYHDTTDITTTISNNTLAEFKTTYGEGYSCSMDFGYTLMFRVKTSVTTTTDSAANIWGVVVYQNGDDALFSAFAPNDADPNQGMLLFDYSDGQNAYVAFKSESPATPEPATATLSLMALAGLCARRRRH